MAQDSSARDILSLVQELSLAVSLQMAATPDYQALVESVIKKLIEMNPSLAQSVSQSAPSVVLNPSLPESASQSAPSIVAQPNQHHNVINQYQSAEEARVSAAYRNLHNGLRDLSHFLVDGQDIIREPVNARSEGADVRSKVRKFVPRTRLNCDDQLELMEKMQALGAYISNADKQELAECYKVSYRTILQYLKERKSKTRRLKLMSKSRRTKRKNILSATKLHEAFDHCVAKFFTVLGGKFNRPMAVETCKRARDYILESINKSIESKQLTPSQALNLQMQTLQQFKFSHSYVNRLCESNELTFARLHGEGGEIDQDLIPLMQSDIRASPPVQQTANSKRQNFW